MHPKEKKIESLKQSVASTSQLGGISDHVSMVGGVPQGGPMYNGKMILLTVKVFLENGKAVAARPGEFEKAWFRLVNIDTSQTLDYKKIKEVTTPDNPNTEEATGSGEGEDSSNQKSFTYVAGRIYFDHVNRHRWIYE